MSQATDALDGDEISATEAGVAQGVVGGDAGAEERGGFGGGEVVGDGGDAAGFGDHNFGIAAVDGDAGDYGVEAIDDVTAAAGLAGAVFAAEEADAYSLTNFPFRDAGAEGFDAADYFVAGNAREFETGIGAGYGGGVGVADAAGFYADANLAGAGLGDGALYHFEDIWRGDFYCFVGAFHSNAPSRITILATLCGYVCFSASCESDCFSLLRCKKRPTGFMLFCDVLVETDRSL